jgi:hypothetical protein
MKSRPTLPLAQAVGLIAAAVVIYSIRGAVGSELELTGPKYNVPRQGRLGLPGPTDAAAAEKR